MIISIVGGGATGITALRHLAELACADPSRNPVTAVQLFDKSGFDGGMAYRTASDQHLLNIKASRMSIVAGDSAHFQRWTEQRGLKVAPDDNLPRKLYRDYLDAVRLDAIDRCRSAGIEVRLEQAEVMRAQFVPGRDLLLTTDNGDIHRSSVMILCTGHNTAQDVYGLSVSRNYIRDPYSKFTFSECDEVEVDILGSGLSAVDAATELASTHRTIHITCLSRSGLFPTVQPVSSPQINDDFRVSLHRYVRAHNEIQADAFAAKISELLQSVAGISCDLSCQDLDTDALADLEHNIAEAQTSKPNAHSYIAGIADVVCDAWSRMNPAEKIRFTDRYNSGWLRNRSAMPLASAVKVRDLMHEGRLSTVARLRDVKVAGGRFHIKLGGDVHREADYIIDATGPSYLLNTSPFYLDLDRQGVVSLDGLGGISCTYDDSRVLDRDGNPHPNIYAVGAPTKGTHFFVGAVDINMQRAQAVIEAIFRDAGSGRPRGRQPVKRRSTSAKSSAVASALKAKLTTMAETDRIADLIRRQDPALNDMPLAPDGKYQTRTVTLDQLSREAAVGLAEGFRDRTGDDFPTLYCGWGRCRVGSTALNNLFGLAGIPAFYQPVKGLLRHLLVGEPVTPWTIPRAKDQPHIFSKETAGPYLMAESLFLPLEPLLMAGYPADRLHLIMLDRDPASSLASWLDKWSDRVPPEKLIQNYVIATLNTLRIERFAAQHGIPVTHYVYEASKEAADSVRNLFDRLGLSDRFAESTLTNWNERGAIESESSGVTFPSEPEIYHLPGLHGSDDAYRYRPRKTTSLTDAQMDVLERYGIHAIYRASVAGCIRDLALDPATSQRLFGDSVGAAA